MRYVAHVEVSLKPGLLDPQGKAIEGSLPALGWSNVSDVRVGKYVRLIVDASNREAAAAQVDEMSRRLLSNPVIEDAVIREVVEDAAGNGRA
jgi:phosphoribosylformylglycinamidine synthase PurS subunit